MTDMNASQHNGSPRPKGPSRRSEPKGAWAQSLQIVFRLAFIGMLVLAALWSLGNVRRIPAQSRAVVLRFGEFDRVRDAGLLFALPRPIEEVVIIPARDTQIRLGAPNDPRPPPSNNTSACATMRRRAPNGDFFLTGDGGVVHLDAHIYYRITDPRAYVLSMTHVEPALFRIYEARRLSLIARRELDEVHGGAPGAAARGGEPRGRRGASSSMLDLSRP